MRTESKSWGLNLIGHLMSDFSGTNFPLKPNNPTINTFKVHQKPISKFNDF